MDQYIVGIDLSLVSPAVAVYCVPSDKWYLYCFAQRICEQDAVLRPDPGVTITVLPPIPSSQQGSDCFRYDHVRQHLHKIISPLVPNCTVYLEGYAFSRQNNATHKLQELGGIIKYDLYHLLGQECTTVPPSKWKRGCSGQGKLSKLEMVYIVKNAGPKVDLFKMFKRVETQQVPCPVQDIADAVGIVLSVTNPVHKGKKRKPSESQQETTGSKRARNETLDRIVE